MMINCNKATKLVSESQERPLTFGERFSLKFHLLMCSICAQFQKTVDLLGLQASEYGTEELDADDSACLSDDAKQRIQRALEDSQG